MSRKKIHIDKLFKEGLKNFSLFVSDRDFNAIDDKTSVFKEQPDTNAPAGPDFSDFELEISDNDWLATKAKLDIEKNTIATDTSIANAFDEFIIEPDPEDWPITLDKFKKAKRRRVAFWWLSTGILLLITGASAFFALTDHNKQNISTQNTSVNVSENKTDFDTKTETNTSNTKVPQELVIDASQNPAPAATTQNNIPASKNNTQGSSNKVQIAPNTNPQPGSVGSARPGNIVLQSSSSTTDGNSTPETPLTKTPTQQKDGVTLGQIKTVQPIEPAQVLVDASTEKGLETKDSSKKKPKDDKKPNDPPKPGTHIYLALVNQVDYSDRILPGTNNSIYNDIRNNADKGSMHYTVGIEAGVLKDKYQMSTGFNFTKQTWNSQYNYTYKLFDSIPVYDSGRTRIKGYLLFPKKDTTMNEARSVSITKIQLPFNYTHLFTINDKLKLSTGISGIISYNIGTKGDKMISHENRQLYYYQRLKQYERPLNIAPSIQLGLMCQLQPKLMLSGSLAGSIQLRSRFKPAFGAREYNYSTGLNIKLIYLLN